VRLQHEVRLRDKRCGANSTAQSEHDQHEQLPDNLKCSQAEAERPKHADWLNRLH
jgi:hypothetical protein